MDKHVSNITESIAQALKVRPFGYVLSNMIEIEKFCLMNIFFFLRNLELARMPAVQV